MSAKIVLIGGGLVVLLAALGVPISSWMHAAAMVCLVFGAVAAMLGAGTAAARLLGFAVGFVFFALLVSASGTWLRQALADPKTQIVLALAARVVVILAAVALLVKIFGGHGVKTSLPKFPVRERVSVIADPIFPVGDSPTPRGRRPATEGRGRSPTSPESDDDDLGIFKRRTR